MSKIIDRIVNLQKLSARNENDNEAESAARLALRLMREHAISQADVDAAASRVEDPLIERVVIIEGLVLRDKGEDRSWLYRRTAPWKRSLGFAVARYLGLQAAYTPRTPLFTFYGHASDVEAAVRLYGVCAQQIDRQCLAWLDEEGKRVREDWGEWHWGAGPAKEAGRKFRNSAVRGLEAKFAELSRESAVEDEDGHALVVTRAKQVEDWVNATYSFGQGNAKELGGDVEFNGDGWAAGKSLRLTEDASLEDRGGPKALEG
jgi:hypothetical protein